MATVKLKQLSRSGATDGQFARWSEAKKQWVPIEPNFPDDDGPFDSTLAGAFEETLPANSPFPTSIIWWDSSARSRKIYEQDVTYNANKTLNTVTHHFFDADGVTELFSGPYVDTYDYTAGFLTPNRTRTHS